MTLSYSQSLRQLALTAAVLLASPSLAQTEESAAAETSAPAPSAAIQGGTFGLSASLFGAGSGSIGGLYFLSPNSALHLTLGTTLGIVPATFGFNVGVGYRMYMARSGPVALYLEPGATVGFSSTTNLNFNVGAGLGLEYFLAERLSVGAEANLTLRTNNRFETVLIDTSMSQLFLSIYF
ncbi:MAG: hypothetical protein M3Y59_26120 [Myxococcota bacterium]|nr:hypothetical protein [Myxococcota bacterium]